MKLPANKILAILVSMFLFGCAGLKITEDRKTFHATKTVLNSSYDIYIPYVRYVSTPVDIDSYCKTKEWKSIVTTNDFTGGIVSIFTLGIVNPQKIVATCSVN